jgi:methionyl-tRNA formyltransferase
MPSESFPAPSAASPAASTRPTVLLVGQGPTAFSALESLLPSFHILAILRNTGVDTSRRDDVLERAAAEGIPVSTDSTLEGLRVQVERLNPDCVVISSYDRIVPADLIRRCPFINVHYAPLPRYRGRANVNWAIINGEPHAGITIHAVVPGLDAGNILFQKLIPIGDQDSVADLYERLNDVQRVELASVVLRHIRGNPGTPQDETMATYCCARNPRDGLIDWSLPTRAIHRLIRALVPPFPGAFTYYQGHRVFVWRAEPVPNPPRYVGRVPGRVSSVSRRDGYVDVITGDSVLRLLEIQAEGGSPTPPATLIRSSRDTLGLHLSDLLSRVEFLEREIARLSTAEGKGSLD